MIVVLKASNTDVILLDCIPSFSEGHNATVTSHPVEDGSRITDHFIVDNTKIKISGIVSDYNFVNPLKTQVNKIEGYSSTIDNAAKNMRVAANQNVVVSSFNVAQIVSSQSIRTRLKQIADKGEFVEIFLYREDSGLIESFPNCLLTSLDFQTDQDSGNAIYPSMQFEQVRIVKVRVTQGKASKIPKYKGQGTEGNDLGNLAQDVKNAVKGLNLPKPETSQERAVSVLNNQTAETAEQLQNQRKQNQRDSGTLGRMEHILGWQ